VYASSLESCCEIYFNYVGRLAIDLLDPDNKLDELANQIVSRFISIYSLRFVGAVVTGQQSFTVKFMRFFLAYNFPLTSFSGSASVYRTYGYR